ncbi:putative ABC transporter permease [Treponema bryantii]|uniref:putative ABC transporter permease n=1 Tax=Treponema bryantii TaxID=163 RepID=UPI002B2EAF4A|nr:membrane protein [Treponema bryantii]
MIIFKDMNMMPVYELPFKAAFLIFIMFSMVGWISEVLYVGIFHEHKFVNRGFLYGPLCPVYGFGGIVILLLPAKLYSTWIPLFFASMILCTIVEYFVSWFMEKMFHTRWWDYSHYKFNINGRICLLNSVLFGFLGLGVIRFVYPQMLHFLTWLGDFVVMISADAIGVFLTIDIFLTVRKLVDFSATMEKIKVFGESLRDHYGNETWFRSENIEEMLASVREHAAISKDQISQSILDKIDRIQNARHAAAESFMAHFPTMKSIQYKDELEHLKSHVKARIKAHLKK